MKSNESFAQKEQKVENNEFISDKESWQNPGKFPPFNKEIAEREKARSIAEKQYQDELTRPYEQNEDNVTKFTLETEDGQIDGYEFAGSDFKMLVSVVGAVGQSIGNHPKEVDLDKWAKNYKREYISTSLISNKKMNLFNTSGLIFGFNNLREGDFLSAAPMDHGVLRDIGKMKQYKDAVMNPDELIDATGSGLTPWNEVEICGDARPDSIIVFGDSAEAISEKDKEAAKYFGVPIYLIRTDVYGKPLGKKDVELSKEAKKFWKDREDPISGRIEQTRDALKEEAKSYYETGNVGEFMMKYLGEFGNELEHAKEISSNQDDFIKNLISELGETNMAYIKEHIEDGD